LVKFNFFVAIGADFIREIFVDKPLSLLPGHKFLLLDRLPMSGFVAFIPGRVLFFAAGFTSLLANAQGWMPPGKLFVAFPLAAVGVQRDQDSSGEKAGFGPGDQDE
jgi:hypothetical protein